MSVTYELKTPEPPRQRWHERRGLLAAAAVLLLGGVGIGLAAGTLNSTKPTPAPGATAQPTRPGQLAGGTVAVGEGGTRDVLGVRVGYPRTADGAVAAATNHSVAFDGPLMFNQTTRPVVVRTLFAPDRVADMLKATNDAIYIWTGVIGLDANGNVLDPTTKKPRPDLFLRAENRPQDGAYRLDFFSPDEAKVTIWSHYLLGPGSDTDTSELGVIWQTETYALRWIDGDWKITGIDGDWKTSTIEKWNADFERKFDSGPHPAEKRSLSPPSLAERARLVPGFTLYANTTGQ